MVAVVHVAFLEVSQLTTSKQNVSEFSKLIQEMSNN